MQTTRSEAKLLGRYDARDLCERLAAAGVFRALEGKGFEAFDLTIDATSHALPSVLLSACRAGDRHLLLEASLGELTIDPEILARRGYPADRPLEFLLVYWLREQDPTRRFSPVRPPLPLQRHPGLGVLRSAFRVVVSMATELGKDGVASVPKFFHDAVLFYRSRLFLFLDGAEQGRFEALARDLARLSLADASVALACGSVREQSGNPASWCAGYQLLPLSERAIALFHSQAYEVDVARALEGSSFTCDDELLARARASLRECGLLGLGSEGDPDFLGPVREERARR
jgi:hypothetical protein